MPHPESPATIAHRSWSLATEGDCCDARERQLCVELLAGMADGGVAPYPYCDGLHLIEALGRRPAAARPPRRVWLGALLRRLATWHLTQGRERRRMEPPQGGSLAGEGRSSVAGVLLRGLRP